MKSSLSRFKGSPFCIAFLGAVSIATASPSDTQADPLRLPELSAAKVPSDSVPTIVENFRHDFLHRVAANEQTVFKKCFSGAGAAVSPDSVISIRHRVSFSSDSEGPDYAQKPIIIIDPGHGHETPGTPYGYDTGAISGGIKETQAIDAIVPELKMALERDVGADVVLTRGAIEKEGITLTKNYKYADQSRALQWRSELTHVLVSKFPERPVLFLSVHANASGAKTAGAEIYYYKGGGVSSASRDFAQSLGKYYRTPSGGGVFSEDFGVLRCQDSKTPAVLLELGYLTNASDRNFLRTAINDQTQAKKMADMISSGVINYLENRKHERAYKPTITIAKSDLSLSL